MDYHPGFSFPLRLDINPSRLLIRSLALVHCSSIVPVIVTDLPGTIKSVLVLSIILNFLWLYKHRLHITRRVIVQDSNTWLLGTERDQFTRAELLPGAFVHPFLTALRFRQNAKTVTVLLTVDNAHPDHFRRLRVLLRVPPPG